MSDFLKKAEELEAKLKKIADNKSAVKAQPKVVVNHLSIEQAEDDKRAQALANMLLAKMSGAGTIKLQPSDQELFGRLVPSE